MAKKQKQLTAKREAFAAAADELIRVWVGSKAIKEWLKEFNSAYKRVESTRSDYVDELRDYGTGGDRSKTRDDMRDDAGDDDDTEYDDAPWVASVDEKISLLEDELPLSWAEAIAEEMPQVIAEGADGAKQMIDTVKAARKLGDPADIEDDDPDYF